MGGRRIDDHSFWAGKAESGCVFPKGVHKKEFSSADGAGELERYEQTSDEIQRMQEISEDKVERHGRKDFMRN